MRDLGSIGPGFFKFHGLEEVEAKSLLFKVSGITTAVSAVTQKHAASITHKLQYLPFAIAQAGAAIRQGLCSFHDYLCFFNNAWKRYPSLVYQGRIRSRPTLFITLELNIQGLEAQAKYGAQAATDALQLLATLAFFHPSDILFELIRSAITSVALERQQAEMNELLQVQLRSHSLVSHWSVWSKEVISTVFSGWRQTEGPANLLNVGSLAPETSCF
jgi:hypothetical protein